MPASRRSLVLLDSYHDSLVGLKDRAARAVVQRFGAIDTEDMGPSLEVFVADAAALLTLAQEQAATMSDAFLRSFIRSETGKPAELETPDEMNPGTTTDGRDLAEALGAIPAKLFLGFKNGWDLDKALRFGAFAARRTAETEVMDAAGQEMTHQIDALDLLVGWRWKSRGTCAACLSMDSGRRHAPGQLLERHPGCQCIQEPVLNVRETVQRETGRERFDSLPKTEQDSILGDKLAGLIRTGAVAWSQLVKVEEHAEWHPTIVARPLQEILQDA